MGATPVPTSAPTQAGATMSLEWNPWNPGHKRPIITCLANAIVSVSPSIPWDWNSLMIDGLACSVSLTDSTTRYTGLRTNYLRPIRLSVQLPKDLFYTGGAGRGSNDGSATSAISSNTANEGSRTSGSSASITISSSSTSAVATTSAMVAGTMSKHDGVVDESEICEL